MKMILLFGLPLKSEFIILEPHGIALGLVVLLYLGILWFGSKEALQNIPFITWLAILNRLSRTDRMTKWSPTSDPSYGFCGN